MSHADFLIKKYNQRVPYENRGKEHDKLRKRENKKIKTLIKNAYESERTDLGRSVLKQLLNQMNG